MSLMERMVKVSSVKGAALLGESDFFTDLDECSTPLPVLNIAFSGKMDGGFSSGLTILAGESRTFKTLSMLYCMKAYLTTHSDSMAILYDSEYGITPDALQLMGIDPMRVLHVPVENVEQLKFDIVKRLEEIKRGDKVFIGLDSLAALASLKERDDAMDEKSVADMTRAKAIRSLFRLITPHLTAKDIPMMVINHVYQTLSLFSSTVLGGGTSVLYSANQVLLFTRSQEKDSSGELKGFNFNISMFKSRRVKEKSKLTFQVTYEGGIFKWSGMLELALEYGAITSPTKGWYQMVDKESGELLGTKMRAKDLITDEFWEPIANDPGFKSFVHNKYSITGQQAEAA